MRRNLARRAVVVQLDAPAGCSTASSGASPNATVRWTAGGMFTANAAHELRTSLTTMRIALDVTVDGEPTLLERMTANLVDNAVRYNHRGGHVTVETRAAGGAAALLEPFVRGDSSRTRGDGGLGLGLSIVAAVATAHGGTIAVTPRPGGGLDVTPPGCLGAATRPAPRQP